MTTITEVLKFLLSTNVSGIRINTYNYNKLININITELLWEPITDLNLIKIGLIGTYYNISIFIDKNIKNNTVQLRLENEINWSVSIPFNDINKFERFLNLKVFW